MSRPQTLSQFPIADYSTATRANPVGTIWAICNKRMADSHVGGAAEPVSKVVDATLSGGDGTAVGITADGVTYSITGITTAAQFAAAWNAKVGHRAFALASSPSADVVRFTLEGLADPTITSYSPGTPDFSIVEVTDGSAPVYIPPGRVVIADSTGIHPGAVTLPTSTSVGADFIGVALRTDNYTDDEAELRGWEPRRGAFPGLPIDVIPGGYPKVELDTSPGAGTRGGAVYVVNSGLKAGCCRADDGGTRAVYTLTFSAANGTDAVGAYFNGVLVTLGGSVAGTAVNATNAANFETLFEQHPTLASKFTVTVNSAVVTMTATDDTAWTIVKYKPATSDVTVANTTARVAATAVLMPDAKWGKGHASSATVGYLAFNLG